MLCHLDMTGHSTINHPIVLVGTHLALIMPCPCPTGGFPSIRHNEVRDITASLLSEVCHGVSIEPHLQPLSGETMAHNSANVDSNSRLDVSAYGFWGGRFERAFFDVRVFYFVTTKKKKNSIRRKKGKQLVSCLKLV